MQESLKNHSPTDNNTHKSAKIETNVTGITDMKGKRTLYIFQKISMSHYLKVSMPKISARTARYPA